MSIDDYCKDGEHPLVFSLGQQGLPKRDPIEIGICLYCNSDLTIDRNKYVPHPKYQLIEMENCVDPDKSYIIHKYELFIPKPKVE